MNLSRATLQRLERWDLGASVSNYPRTFFDSRLNAEHRLAGLPDRTETAFDAASPVLDSDWRTALLARMVNIRGQLGTDPSSAA
jgi:hypothetical protein